MRNYQTHIQSNHLKISLQPQQRDLSFREVDITIIMGGEIIYTKVLKVPALMLQHIEEIS